jgi:hypothetical protein
MEQLTQGLAVLGQFPSKTVNGGAADVSVTDIDLARFQRIMLVVNVGNVTGGGSLSIKFRESKTAGGTYQDLVTNPAALAALTTTNRVATLEIRADQLDAGYEYVQVSITETGNQNVIVGFVVLGGEAVYKPGKQKDITAATPRTVI